MTQSLCIRHKLYWEQVASVIVVLLPLQHRALAAVCMHMSKQVKVEIYSLVSSASATLPTSHNYPWCLSLPLQPAGNSLKHWRYCSVVTAIRRTRIWLRKWHQVWPEGDTRGVIPEKYKQLFVVLWSYESIRNSCQMCFINFFNGRNCSSAMGVQVTRLSHRSVTT